MITIWLRSTGSAPGTNAITFDSGPTIPNGSWLSEPPLGSVKLNGRSSANAPSDANGFSRRDHSSRIQFAAASWLVRHAVPDTWFVHRDGNCVAMDEPGVGHGSSRRRRSRGG